MKVLFVSQYFYPESFKGNDIVFDLVQRGHEVTVLTAKPNYPNGSFFKGYNFFNKREEYINGARVIRTPVYPRKNGIGLNLALNYVSFIFFSYFACIFRVKGQFDIIFVQQLSPVTMALPGLWIKRRKRIPLVLWILDLWPESMLATSKVRISLVTDYLNRLVKNIYNQSDAILISSEFFRNSVSDKIENAGKPIIYFPNWAEDVFSEASHSKVDVPSLPTGFNIMFAGNIGEAQDFQTIVEAVKLTKNAGINWIVVGDGRKGTWLEMAKEKDKLENLILLGRFPLESMPRLFERADAMLVSLKDEPVFSLTVPAKIQAYMASGKIILGVLNGEGNELINKSSSGFAVPAGNFRSLANCAVKLKNLTDAERKVFSNNSRSYYDANFSKPMLMDKLEAILKGMVN